MIRFFRVCLWAVEFTSVVFVGRLSVMAKSEAIKVGDKHQILVYLPRWEGCSLKELCRQEAVVLYFYPKTTPGLHQGSLFIPRSIEVFGRKILKSSVSADSVE